MRARTTRFLGATAIAACACLTLTGTASAVAPANGLEEVIAAAGSDTTVDITGAILANANSAAAKAAWNTDPDNYVNVPPVLAAGQTFTVPADPFADEVVYGSNLPVPNGSSQGKAALKASAEAGDGKIDIARSSSARGSSDPASFEYFAFATDGVTWSSSATGSGAGLTLTLAQLRGIYDGSITNWNQVGGANSPISVYLPQTGSGTLSFFTGTVLGFDPTTKPVTIKRFQEHDGNSIPVADRAKAIAPFSIAQWIAQGNAVTADKRAGFTVNPLTGAGFNGSPVAGSAGSYTPAFTTAFLGSRSVYNIVDSRTPSYDQAKRAIGFDAGDSASTASPLCGGQLATTIQRYGFLTVSGPNGLSCVKS
ncbi:substrate-binding domain-containing protein [Amycolatopsis thailandensis]|uniref:Phosphate ABC transporter substrate-binding protein n=1 Tax=Amycolatopsis thailandensis TaxID=589330 RepID=A0A229SCR8_9PSEU|nr:substrate-binding domain-containing protein [Amycolatopsis thailandensis]OXM56640.1 phosphate ABC transporter substrate-binding protein [Amycolatopsis thailandensis]